MVSIETKDSKSYLSKATVCASKNKFFFGGVTWKTTISHKVREYSCRSQCKEGHSYQGSANKNQEALLSRRVSHHVGNKYLACLVCMCLFV